jgi:hypothetical protein
MKNSDYILPKIVKRKFKSKNFEEKIFVNLSFRVKEKKALEQSIKKLREMARDVNRVDDEVKRELYTEQIKWWIKQSEEDIIELKGFLTNKFIKFISKLLFLR